MKWAAALTFCVAFSGGATAADITIRLSHGDNPSENPTHLTATKFRDLVAKKTGGKVDGKIFPSNQLGSEEEVVRAVGSGTIQAQIPAMGNVHPVAPSA
ncbi:MAG: C4-dicarboxylate ABC transporter substrate-binding protein, partial [Gemmatimonadaceae bacterium]|nr:C4-dicarboxylate ABC transporter substrate-binding protein [Gemmatimonadaceae bacterium]